MPTYEYHCYSCQKTFEAVQKISEPPLSTCPHCNLSNVRRLISAAAFHLKGSGWYKTDYAANGKGAAQANKSESGDIASGASESTSKKEETVKSSEKSTETKTVTPLSQKNESQKNE